MADIFVSYARADKARVEPLVAALAAQGWSVWWDPAIAGGQEFDSLITQELESARATIVVWTETSVASRWVRGEARVAADRGVLVPVQFGTPSVPLDARALHTIDFDSWGERAQSAPFQDLLRALTPLLGTAARPLADIAPVAGGLAANPSVLKKLKPWHFAAFAAALVAVIALMVFAGINMGGKGAAEKSVAAGASLAGGGASQTEAPTKPRVAIMPFENLSPDPGNAFFADGLHEEVLTALANGAPDLEVISRTTMMSYKDKPVTVEQVAKDLNCAYVLEGSVRREGDNVRLTVQLIDARSDEHIWAQNYDRKLVNAMTLQSEVAGEVADQLQVKLVRAAERAKPPTTSAEAYDLYLKANLAFQGLVFYAPPEFFYAVDDQVKAALKLDPDFALAHTLRAGVRSYLFQTSIDVSEENVKLWRAEIDAAARLAPEEPSVIAAQGNYSYLVDSDLFAALNAFNRVEAKGLSDPYALISKVNVLIAMGQLDEALALARRVAKTDPDSLAVQAPLLSTLWMTHRPQEVMQIALRGPSANTPLRYVVKTAFGNTNLSPLGPITPNSFAIGVGVVTGFPPKSDYPALKDALNKVQGETVRVALFDVVYPAAGLGMRPVAELRGWVDLLMGDTQSAVKDGDAVLAFVGKAKPLKWNAWFLRMIAAEGLLFEGKKAEAIAAAKEALALRPCSISAIACVYPQYMASEVFAWAGAQDEAVTVLERLSFDAPGIAPANAVRDPLVVTPLADNARYKELKAKLEAQMAENSKLLEVAAP